MVCCADRFLAALAMLVALAAPAGAQSTQLESRVAEAIAGRWGVGATLVRVELAAQDREWPDGADAFRLLGSGAGGSWIVVLEDGAGVRQLAVRAGVMIRQTVASRDLERGITLAPEDMTLESVVEWGPPQDGAPNVEPGWTVNRRIARGEPLRPPVVGPPLAIRPGDDVSVVVERNGFTITLGGRAAGGAAIGERVAVRAATGKRLEGIAVREGVVRIDASRKEQP